MSGYRWTEEDYAKHTQAHAPQPLPAQPKPSKYRNRKTTVDGIVFDSAKEAKRWDTLKLLKAAGEIFDLAYQVPYALHVNGQLVCRYVADFYYITRDGERVVEDVKSAATRKLSTYRIKRKLMKAIHGIDVQEV